MKVESTFLTFIFKSLENILPDGGVSCFFLEGCLFNFKMKSSKSIRSLEFGCD